MKSPALADWLLRRLVPSHLRDDILGDLNEEYRRLIRRGFGPLRARLWYWRQVLISPLSYRIARRRNPGSRNRAQKRDGRVGAAMKVESLFADIRYAARSLRRSPGFALVAILSLGLGLGANTTIFSLYNALVLRTLPVNNAEELVQVVFANDQTTFSNPLWEEFREHQDVLSSAFAFGDANFNLSSGGEVKNVRGYWVSGDFFSVLGVRRVMGTLVTDADDYLGCPPVAVLSYGFWQREFGGAANTVGRTLLLEGAPLEVVGIVDPGFTGVNVGVATDVYVPICAFPLVNPGLEWLDSPSYSVLRILGRPAQGVSLEQARARLATLSPGLLAATVPQRWDAERQAEYVEHTFTVRSAQNGVSVLRGQYHEALLVLMAVVGVVLLITCANVANLLLARASNRKHEVAVRMAIGSGRWRLVRLFVIESLLLSILGALIAVLLAPWASASIVGMLPNSGSLWLDLGVDARVLYFTIAVSFATAMLFGLAPAWRATRIAPQAALRTAGREVGNRLGRFAVGKLLVIGQIAMSLSLVMGAGLLIGTLTRLNTVDTGFDRDGVLLVNVNLRNAGYTWGGESRRVNELLLDRLRGLPGVRSASASVSTPIGGRAWSSYAWADGLSSSGQSGKRVWLNATSDAFFATLGTPLRAGRDFGPRDAPRSPPVAVINETMANEFFPGAQPVGRQFHLEAHGEAVKTYEVAGVVADTKYQSIDEESTAIAYLPLSQDLEASAAFNLRYQLRTDGEPTALIRPAAELISAIHPRISFRYSTLSDRVAASLSRPRILAVLSGSSGAISLLLAMIGLYGTLAYQVSRRRNEIGVRLALGSGRMRVLNGVLGEVGRLVAIGVALGVVAAFASTRILATFLFGVAALDPKTLAMSSIVLVMVALAAGALPAWHATRLDPVEALREE